MSQTKEPLAELKDDIRFMSELYGVTVVHHHGKQPENTEYRIPARLGKGAVRDCLYLAAKNGGMLHIHWEGENGV